MNTKTITLISCFLLPFLSSVYSVDEITEDQFLAYVFEESKGPTKFFSTKTDPEIDRLRFHSSPKISIYAKWISIRRRLRRSKAGGDLVSKSRYLAHEFIGCLEATLNVSVPDWWKKVVISFDLERDFPSSYQHEGFTETNGVRHLSNGLTIDQLDELEITGVLDGKKFKIDGDFGFSYDHQMPDFFAIKRLPNQRILATLSNQISTQHTLVCVDENGSLLWKSNVLGNANFEIGGSGPGVDGYIEIVTHEDHVVVFGVNGLSLYVETFSLESGKVIARFSTLY